MSFVAVRPGLHLDARLVRGGYAAVNFAPHAPGDYVVCYFGALRRRREPRTLASMNQATAGTLRVVLVEPGNGPPRSLSVPASPRATLAALQGLVGGDIEAVCLPLDHVGFIHESGKLCALPANRMATQMWQTTLQARGLSCLPGDYLAGPLVVVGPTDPEGNPTSVSADYLAWVDTLT